MHLTHRVSKIGKGCVNGFAKTSFSTTQSPTNEKKVYWNESATVLIAKPVASETSNGEVKSGVEFLITTRSEKSKFMPGGLCFPGGNISQIDSSAEWLDLYSKFGLAEKIKNFRWFEPSARKPEMYQVEDSQGGLLKEVSLRITAIRETFEECGMLFCRPGSDSATGAGAPAKGSSCTIELSDSEIIKWQKRVKTNPIEFLTMCHDLQVVPSVYDFCDWSNWLTPIMFKPSKTGRSRRFDTIFYMVLLKTAKSPTVIIDPDEVSSYMWSTPFKLLEDHISDMHKLMPPQLYEMGRLRDVRSTEELEALLKARQQLGVQRWCPHVRLTSDGPVGCMPGDDLMPSNPDIYNYSEIEKLDQTLAELETSSTKLHRWQIGSDGIYKLLVNTHNYGQIYPSNENVSLAPMKLFS